MFAVLLILYIVYMYVIVCVDIIHCLHVCYCLYCCLSFSETAGTIDASLIRTPLSKVGCLVFSVCLDLKLNLSFAE